MRIGITLTSSLSVDQDYITLTERVATYIASKSCGLVYGGTAYGMMLTLGESYKRAGGNDLTGVMAKDLTAVTKGYVAYDSLDESYMEETMEDRKRRIIQLSDAFLILPGGWGTFEEIGSIVGGKANKLYDKPIAFLNHNNFYNQLFAFFGSMQAKRFSKISLQEMAYISDDLDEIYSYFCHYSKRELADKFM